MENEISKEELNMLADIFIESIVWEIENTSLEEYKHDAESTEFHL